MKIKAADIARNLNLSKATVSLVLNNKPGVSEKTRRKVFDYIEEVTGEPEKQKEEKDKQKSRNWKIKISSRCFILTIISGSSKILNWMYARIV